jgi:hypothetical protein
MLLRHQSFFRLNKKYLFLALLLLVVEVIIAVFVHDTFIRPWGGDFLVVILMYCLVRGATCLPAPPAALAVLVLSYLIETLQFFQIVQILGLEGDGWASVVIGAHFAWSDIVAYSAGIVCVLMIENRTFYLQNS